MTVKSLPVQMAVLPGDDSHITMLAPGPSFISHHVHYKDCQQLLEPRPQVDAVLSREDVAVRAKAAQQAGHCTLSGLGM